MGGQWCVGSGGGRGRDGWDSEVKGGGGRRCMLARAQCNGCAACAVEMDNVRCVCSHLWVAQVTRCGRCCLLLHALNLPQQLDVRCCHRRRKGRRRRSCGWGLF